MDNGLVLATLQSENSDLRNVLILIVVDNGLVQEVEAIQNYIYNKS